MPFASEEMPARGSGQFPAALLAARVAALARDGLADEAASRDGAASF
jgi:hypothetical protein